MLLFAGQAALADPALAEAGRATGAGEQTSATDNNKDGTQQGAEAIQNHDAQETLCLTIEASARASDLPLEFFARVIWQESRFQADAIGPVTRNGQRALGIAQFMPATARERRLLDPLDPVQALPKAAEFLDELRKQFGNLGLAAAAYNAGPRRVQEWLAGSGGMPEETRNYVLAITGTSIDDWAKVSKSDQATRSAPSTSCRELIALLRRAPNRFVAQLAQRVTRAVVKPWGVQLAAGFNRDQALAMYVRAIKNLTAVVGPQDDPLLLRVRGTSSFFQVRIGANTRREADDLCRRIHRAGGACLVKRRGA
ncbi:transglycosylase SLT domain-containing protein [Bradyrhizobium sp. HKCCYLS1011]|uniref:transglycosylase SLT domain-containing protein n=1 Tax=Bradyrhizobium sp. HKCCYLS1011 TaxID=3420733 RepID=UPI003EB87909